jgi:hypothetical protein
MDTFKCKWVLHFQIKNRFLPSQKKRHLPVCEYMKSTRRCRRETTIWIPGSTGSQLLYSKVAVWERQENGTVIYNKSYGYFETGFEGARVNVAVDFRISKRALCIDNREDKPYCSTKTAYSVLSGNIDVRTPIKLCTLFQLHKPYSVQKTGMRFII